MSVERRNVNISALLVIDGLETAYYMGTRPPPAPAGHTVNRGLIDFGSVASRLALLDATPETGTVTVRLGIVPATRALLRLIPDGAPSCALAESMPAEQAAAPLTVEVDRDPTGILIPGELAYIGQEAVLVDSISAVAPFTFTVDTGDRGALGSPIQRHTFDPATGRQPRVYGACVAWRRRSARLVIGEVTAAGGWRDGATVTLLEGFISGLPQVTRDGVIEVQLESLPSALRVEVGGPDLATGLVQDWHIFDGDTGRYFQHIEQLWTHGAAYQQLPVNVVPFNPGPGVVIDIAPGALGQIFDLGGASDDPTAAVVTAFSSSNSSWWMRVTAVGIAADGPDIPGTITVDRVVIGSDRRIIRNRRASLVPRLDLAGGAVPAVRTRAQMMATITAGFSLPATAGPGGVFALGAFDDDGLTLAPIWQTGTDGPMLARVQALRDDMAAGIFDGADPFIGNRPAPYVEVNAGPPVVVPLQMARAWWQPGERLLVVDDITPGATAATPAYVIAYFDRGGEEQRIILRVVGRQIASAVTAGAPGFALTVARAARGTLPMVDTPGRPAVRVQPVAAWRGETAARILFELARSRYGLDHGTGDTQPYGAGLPLSRVDAVSFFALDADPLGGRTLLLEEGEDLLEVASDLARSAGFLLIERTNRLTGERQLALTRSGLPTPGEVVATIADGDWLVDGRPVCQLDESLVTRIEYQLAEGDPFTTPPDDLQPYSVTVVNGDAEGEQGAGRGETIRLLGVQIPSRDLAQQQATLLPIAASRFAALSYPRRSLAGSIAYAKGARLYAGAVIRVTAREALGPEGQPLTGSTIGRVVAVDPDPLGASCAVRVVYWPTNTTGWAATMDVQSVAGAVVTVENNTYSPAQAVDGSVQRDSDFFRVGDSVLCVVPGNRGASALRTILSISNTLPRDVTLSAAPPAGTARIRGPGWATSGAHLRELCHQASGGPPPVLPGGAPAQVYA